MLNYDTDKLNEIVANNNTYLNVKWLFNGRVPVITAESSFTTPDPPKYLLPLHSGVWISCIDLQGELQNFNVRVKRMRKIRRYYTSLLCKLMTFLFQMKTLQICSIWDMKKSIK